MKHPLNLSEVRKKFDFTINKNISFEPIEIMYGEDLVSMDFDVFLPTIGMNLQRPLCWSLHQKQQLILSILKGNTIPKLSIISVKNHNGGFASYQVIDGKQRLNAYMSFVKGEFALPTGHYYNDLARSCRNEIWNFIFVCDTAYTYVDKPISDANKIAWFTQINFTGTPQDEAHLINLLNK